MLQKTQCPPVLQLCRCRIRSILISAVLVLAYSCSDTGDADALVDLPVQSAFKVSDFSSAAECQSCHPHHYTEWAASMHAYSVTDPVWIAQQQHEHKVHNEQGVSLGDFCVQCHSPVAALTDVITDHENFSAAELNTLPAQIREGVTCDVCHMVTHLPEPTNIYPDQQLFETTDFKMYTDGTRYGLITDPQVNEFHPSASHPGYERSEFCQNCHNLTVDGIEAEVTQFEWAGSAFAAMGTECQTCHMPTYTGQAAENGPLRDNLHRHFFPGVDIQLNANAPEPGLLNATEQLLQNSADVNFFEPLTDTITAAGSLEVKLIVSNNVGHNFPSGTTFARQLWLEIITVLAGDTIFTSGVLNDAQDISDFYIDPTATIDPQLRVFNTVLYNTTGDSGLLQVGVEDMTWMNDYTLPISGSRVVDYTINLPENPAAGSKLLVEARLRFRSFPPFYLRHLGLEAEADRLPIFDIDHVSASAYVQ